jgi:hypothetical protein
MLSRLTGHLGTLLSVEALRTAHASIRYQLFRAIYMFWSPLGANRGSKFRSKSGNKIRKT